MPDAAARSRPVFGLTISSLPHPDPNATSECKRKSKLHTFTTSSGHLHSRPRPERPQQQSRGQRPGCPGQRPGCPMHRPGCPRPAPPAGARTLGSYLDDLQTPRSICAINVVFVHFERDSSALRPLRGFRSFVLPRPPQPSPSNGRFVFKTRRWCLLFEFRNSKFGFRPPSSFCRFVSRPYSHGLRESEVTPGIRHGAPEPPLVLMVDVRRPAPYS